MSTGQTLFYVGIICLAVASVVGILGGILLAKLKKRTEQMVENDYR